MKDFNKLISKIKEHRKKQSFYRKIKNYYLGIKFKIQDFLNK